MSSRKKTRKIYLYRGDETVSTLVQPSADSRVKSLLSIRDHFKRNPTLTHAAIVDVRGKTWSVRRDSSRASLFWLLLRLS